MDVTFKKQQLVNQLLHYFDNDMNRVIALGDGLRLLGINTNDEATLDRIASMPEYFTTMISYSELGMFKKLIEHSNKLKGIE